MTNGFSLLLCSGISVEVETLISGQNKESRRIMDRLRGRRLFVGFHRVICCNDLKLCWKDGAGASLPPFSTSRPFSVTNIPGARLGRKSRRHIFWVPIQKDLWVGRSRSLGRSAERQEMDG